MLIVFFLGCSPVKGIAAGKQWNSVLEESTLVITFCTPFTFPGHLLPFLHLSTSKQFGSNSVGQVLGAAGAAQWMGGMFPVSRCAGRGTVWADLL